MGASPSIKYHHGPLPVDQEPYRGPSVQHHYMRVEISHDIMSYLGFSPGASQGTAAVHDYYPTLNRVYHDGFILISFAGIHALVHQETHEQFSILPCQAIFCRYPTLPSVERWQLRIERSLLEVNSRPTTRISSGASSHSGPFRHIIDTITRCTARGGRLICMNATSKLTSDSPHLEGGISRSSTRPDISVDLFFNMPIHSNRTDYIYHCVETPIVILPGVKSNNINFDFMALYAHYLNRGFRLVEICYDHSQTNTPKLGHSTSPGIGYTMNAMWFFEKEASRAEDSTPVYEGCIVENYIRIQTATNGLVQVMSDWVELLDTMGTSGWELGCSLETPKTEQRVMLTKQTVLLFFQRQILNEHNTSANFSTVDTIAEVEPMAPPTYDEAMKESSAGGGSTSLSVNLPTADIGFPPDYTNSGNAEIF